MNDKIEFFECKYCLKKLSTEKRLEIHNCVKKERWEYLSTKQGFHAYEDYQYWLYCKNNKKINNKRTFIDSRFFVAFKEFQTFCNDKGIPDKKMYIDYMVERQIPPMLWRLSDSYNLFISYYDNDVPNDIKIQFTFNLLDQLVNILECDKREIFTCLTASDISKLVFERRLSPWVLLLNKNFLYYLHNIPSVEQYRLLTTTIDIDFWKLKFKNNPAETQRIKKIVENYFNDISG